MLVPGFRPVLRAENLDPGDPSVECLTCGSRRVETFVGRSTEAGFRIVWTTCRRCGETTEPVRIA